VSSIIRADKWQNALGVAYNTVLQVVSTTKTDTFTSTATTPTAITGASLSITPKFSSSKIFISYSFSISASAGTETAIQILRDSTVVGGGTTAGSRLSATSVTTIPTNQLYLHSGSFLDSPATTSAITYSLRGWTINGTFYIGRSSSDTDNNSAANARTALTITALEIAQ
jgi:hypothetical protein